MGVTIQNDEVAINSYYDDISKGLNPNETYLNIAGLNPDIAGTTEDLWPVGGTLVYLTSQEKMNIASTSVNDIAAGSGVQSIFISGLDDAGLPVSQTVIMDGQDDVLTDDEYAVVTFMFAFSSGSSLTNEGMITATAETAGTVQCGMTAGIGISQHGFFRVPAGKSAIIKFLEFNASRTAGGTAAVVVFKIYARFSPTSPWIVLVQRTLDSDVQDAIAVQQPLSGVLSSGADVRFEATSDQTDTFALIRLTGVLYDV